MWRLVLIASVLVACGSVDPVLRDVSIETTGCGDAFAGGGRGFDLGDGLVVTAAHVVAQADGVLVDGRPGSVVAWDGRSDPALLRVESDLPAADLTAAGAGTNGTILGRAGSVVRAVDVRIEAVLGSERVVRSGYEIAAPVRVGDSGAGFVDASGALVGILFAVGDPDGAAWLVASDEVEVLLSRAEVTHRCNPERSRLEALPSVDQASAIAPIARSELFGTVKVPISPTCQSVASTVPPTGSSDVDCGRRSEMPTAY